jgi:hypothetical protein
MNEQAMQQLLAFLQQQMDASQKSMADLPQRAMQAGATPMQGSGGTILSPDPVRRVQQANEAWRERFPNVVEQAARVGMTPEALLASQGNTATNQWAQLGGVPGVDPEKLREMNSNARAYRQFAEAQRTGTNGRILSVESGAGAPTSAAPAQPAQPATAAPAAPVTAGVSGLDIFGPNPIRSGVQSYVENAPEAFRQAVIPNAPRNTSVAPPIQGSNLRQDVLQGANFIPNLLLGAGTTITEGLGSIFGKQFDLPSVNMQSDFFSNVGNLLNNPQNGNAVSRLGSDAGNAIRTSGSVLPERSSMRQWLNTFGDQPAGPTPGFAGPAYQAAPTAGGPVNQQASPYLTPGMTPESRAQMPVTVGDNERNPFNPAAPVQPNFFNQIPAYGQGQTTPMTPDQTRNMFLTEEEKKRRQQQQPMLAGR